MKPVAFFSLAALSCLAADAWSKTPDNRPLEVVVGESIAKVKLGMSFDSVAKLLQDLRPEGKRRAPDRIGFVSGALLLIVDETSHVVTLSVDLPKSPGLRIGRTVIPPDATIEEIAELLPWCDLSTGTGGRVVECQGPAGKMHFYDSVSDAKALWAIVP
jgi:hypothetical protein